MRLLFVIAVLPVVITGATQTMQAIYCFQRIPELRVPSFLVAASAACYTFWALFGFDVLAVVCPSGDLLDHLFWYLTDAIIIFSVTQLANIWLIAWFYRLQNGSIILDKVPRQHL